MKPPLHLKIEDEFQVQHQGHHGGAAIKNKASNQLLYSPPPFRYPFAPIPLGYGLPYCPQTPLPAVSPPPAMTRKHSLTASSRVKPWLL